MELFLELVTRLGAPIAALVIVLVYHARVVAEKDREIARINDLRVADAQREADKRLQRDEEFMELLRELRTAMTLVSQGIERIGNGGARR